MKQLDRIYPSQDSSGLIFDEVIEFTSNELITIRVALKHIAEEHGCLPAGHLYEQLLK